MGMGDQMLRIARLKLPTAYVRCRASHMDDRESRAERDGIRKGLTSCRTGGVTDGVCGQGSLRREGPGHGGTY